MCRVEQDWKTHFIVLLAAFFISIKLAIATIVNIQLSSNSLYQLHLGQNDYYCRQLIIHAIILCVA